MKITRFLSAREKLELGRDTDTPLQGQCTKPLSQPLTLGFIRRRWVKTRVVLKEYGVCIFVERAEGTPPGSLY